MTDPAVTDGTCEICGEHNVAATQFCTSCGAYLGWEGSVRPAESLATAPAGPRAAESSAQARHDTDVLTDNSAPRAQRDAPEPPARPEVGGTVAIEPDRGRSGLPRLWNPNDAARRFCRKCGYGLRRGSATTAARVASRSTWWARLTGRGPAAERRSRQMYRRSLSLRARVLRAVGVSVALCLALGLFRLVGHDPLGWARHRINDVRGALVTVNGITATADPPGSGTSQNPPSFAVDTRLDTSWQEPWTSSTNGATTLTCGQNDVDAGIVVTAPRAVTLHALRIRGGLPSDDLTRVFQYRPYILELRFSGGGCQRVKLKDSFNGQIVHLHAVQTNEVRISIVGVYPPKADAGQKQVALTEINLLVRPS